MEESVVEPPAKRSTVFFNKLISTKEPRINTLMVTDAGRDEIDGYLTMPCLPEDTNPLVYWKDRRIMPPGPQVAHSGDTCATLHV